jgi:hypothetical protein
MHQVCAAYRPAIWKEQVEKQAVAVPEKNGTFHLILRHMSCMS